MPIINVRLSNIYGPTPLERWDLIHVLCRKLIQDGRAQIWSARPERDFIHIEVAVSAVIALLDADYDGTLNLGTGTLTSISRVRDVLAAVSGGSIEVLDVPVQGPMRFQCDTTTLRRLIDWSPRFTTEEGVRQTYEVMASHSLVSR